MSSHYRHYYLKEELDTLEITLCRSVITSSESEVTNMKIDIEIDRKWQKGECIIPSDCAFRHYYTEEDEQVEEVIYILPIPHISILNYVSV